MATMYTFLAYGDPILKTIDEQEDLVLALVIGLIVMVAASNCDIGGHKIPTNFKERKCF